MSKERGCDDVPPILSPCCLTFLREAWEELRGQPFRDDSFDEAAWNRHRTWRRFLPEPSVLALSLLSLAPVWLWAVLVSVAVGLYVDLAEPRGAPRISGHQDLLAPFTLTSFALSLLMLFKTNSSYSHWWESRTLLGSGYIACRCHLRLCISFVGRSQPHLLPALHRWTAAVLPALACHLRGKEHYVRSHLGGLLLPGELEWLARRPSPPIAALQVLSALLDRAQPPLSDIQRQQLEAQLSHLDSVVGGCERIMRQAIPYAYHRHTQRFLLLYITFLPIPFFDLFGWATPVVMALLAYLLCGIENIGCQIEEPHRVLPLNQICGGTLRALDAMKADGPAADAVAAAADAAGLSASPAAEAAPAMPPTPLAAMTPRTPAASAMPLRSSGAAAAHDGGGGGGGGGMTSQDFLGDRLAAAAAVPAERRTPEVAGLLECCQIKEKMSGVLQEICELVPSVLADLQAAHALVRKEGAIAAQIVRADSLCAGMPMNSFGPSAALCAQFAESLALACRHSLGLPAGASCTDVLQALLSATSVERPAFLHAVLLVAAQLDPFDAAQLPCVARLLQRLLQPAVRRSLEPQLAELQRELPAGLQPLTYDELLGRVAVHAVRAVTVVVTSAPSTPWPEQVDDLHSAAMKALGQVTTTAALQHHPAAQGKMLSGLATAASISGDRPNYWFAQLAALQHARCSGSDYFVATAGFLAAANAVNIWRRPTPGFSMREQPSDALRWLAEAEAAYSRCKRLLPTHWLADVRELQRVARLVRPWLQQLQAAGDRWQVSPPAITETLLDMMVEQHRELADDPLAATRCSACNTPAPQLRYCSACRRASYCSRQCQKNDWPKHKAACREHQRKKAAAGASDSAGSSAGGAGSSSGR